MNTAVTTLCALTSVACAYLMLRAYLARRVPLLFWSGVCFVGFAVNNLLLFADEAVWRRFDLSVARSATALVAVSALLYGLIWESR